MSELAEKKLKEWRSGAIRTLLEIERQAAQIRRELEDDPREPLSDHMVQIESLYESTSSLATYLDKSVGLEEAGL